MQVFTPSPQIHEVHFCPPLGADQSVNAGAVGDSAVPSGQPVGTPLNFIELMQADHDRQKYLLDCFQIMVLSGIASSVDESFAVNAALSALQSEVSASAERLAICASFAVSS